jgi:hypothetical protein
MRRLLLGAGLVAAFAAGCASGPPYQPHMENALASLQNAQSELEQAPPNKGGHRERAMNLIGNAINQVQLGIQFAQGN